MAEKEVVSTQIVKCRERYEVEYQAVVIVYANGDVEVQCDGGCGKYCHYGLNKLSSKNLRILEVI